MSKTNNNSETPEGNSIPAVRRPPAIAKQLRREILDGVHPPGAWLREQHLAERFGVSRGPIREALRLLAEERLVESEPFRGARVARLTPEEIVEIFELRATLFALAARFAAERAPDRALEAFRREIDKMAVMADRGATPFDLVAQGGKATSIITEHCGAPDVQAMLRQVVRKSQWHYTQLGISTFAAASRAARYWQEVARLLVARKPEEAERAVRRVLSFIEHRALARLERGGVEGESSILRSRASS